MKKEKAIKIIKELFEAEIKTETKKEGEKKNG